MNLVIQAHTLKNEPLSQPITGRFDVRGGTIGRADTNTLSLPDPERHISRLHAEVWFSNGSFSIRNVGSANPIMLNGRAIVPGEGAALAQADEIVIGTYVMRVILGDAAQPAAPAPEADGRTVITLAPAAAAGAPVPTFAPLPVAAAAEAKLPPSAPVDWAKDPFAGLVPPAPPAAKPAAPDPFAGLSLKAPAPAPAPAPSAAATLLPPDFDVFASPPPPRGLPPAYKPTEPLGLDAFREPPPPPTPKKPTAAQINAFADLLGDPVPHQGSALDDTFGLGQAPAGADPMDAFLRPASKDGKPSATSQPSMDPMQMFGETAPSAPPSAGPTALHHGHTSMLNDAIRLPTVTPEPAPAPPAPAPARPWYKFGAVTAAPVAAKAPAAEPPALAATTEPPGEPSSRPSPRGGIMQDKSLTPEVTMPAVRIAQRDEPFTFEPPKPMPPIPQPDGSLLPPPAPSPIAIPPLQATGRPPAPATPGQPATAEALWAAFCEGAGISLALPQGLNPELMRVIGQVLHHSVEGTLKLVAVRAAAKQELRAQVTTIQSRNNNPLKFSPDAATALEQLLQPPARGFMVGPAAVNDAMDDLLGHAIGTMAGMRAALAGVLQRFEPARLEGKLSGQSVIDALLPMNRRAKLWELYLQHYERIQGEAEDDFHELFGKAFMRAYDELLNRLDNDRRGRPGAS